MGQKEINRLDLFIVLQNQITKSFSTLLHFPSQVLTNIVKF